MKLNIGSANPSGQYKNSEWINLEYCHNNNNFIKDNKGKLVFGDGCNMPFKNNSFNLIHCIHMMEHIERMNNIKLLNEIYRVLTPGGTVYIEVPDIIKICEQLIVMYRTDLLNYKEAIRCKLLSIYGKGRYNGDTHRWGFYPEILKELMESVGFKVSFPKEMVSNHWRQEPIILACGLK